MLTVKDAKQTDGSCQSSDVLELHSRHMLQACCDQNVHGVSLQTLKQVTATYNQR